MASPAYQSNSVTLYRGDCLDVMPCLEAGSIDMVLCDLPYGTTECAWDAVIPFDKMWEQFRRLVRMDGAIALNSNQPFTTALIASNLRGFAYVWAWDKGVAANFVQAKRMPLRTLEDVCIFANSGKTPRYFPQMVARERPMKMGGTKINRQAIPMRGEQWRNEALKNKVYTEAYPSVVLPFSCRVAGQRGLHPTQKPVGLNEYLIRTYTKEGDTVLDNTMGSGSTGVACMNTGRRFVGIERDAGYFAIAERRIRTALTPKGDGPLFASIQAPNPALNREEADRP
ncbi:site-specific DNA-methyltransferase [Methylorubrum populi]|uniref:DNA-methyltransferase n=1 Tax=Methylorubrum populi TaxID=223967 RepID=UPI0031F82609